MDTKIEEVKRGIKKVEQQIDDVEGQLTKAVTGVDVAYWRKKEGQLRKQMEQLWEEKLLLLKVGTSEGEPISKKPKRSPAKHLSKVGRATTAEQSAYLEGLLACFDVLPISVKDLWEFLSWKSGPLPVLDLAFYYTVNDPKLVKWRSQAELGLAELVKVVLTTFKRRPNNEADSSHMLRIFTGDFLENLNDIAPGGQQLEYLESTMD